MGGRRWLPYRVRQEHEKAVKRALSEERIAFAAWERRRREYDAAIQAAIDAGLSYRDVADLTGRGKSDLHMHFKRRERSIR